MSEGSRIVTVAVVNDHQVIVHGVDAMLEPYGDRLRVIELLADRPVQQDVDVVLYDTFTSADLCQSDLADLLGNPHVGRIVLYTWVLTPELVARARRLGISGAVSKRAGGEALAQAVLSASTTLDVIQTPAEPDNYTGRWPGQDAGLTAREAEVIALVTSGLSNNEIAARTYLSINSVKSYIRSAYRTMNVTSRSQAVLWGVDHGMRPEPMREVRTAGG